MMRFAGSFALALASTISVASSASLADIDHVVLFMQENRAFDHYFGTMAGVRGFSDPNAQVNSNGRSTFYQDVDSALSTATDYLLPWHLNYLKGNWTQATQCMLAGSNSWQANHAALNGDLNNNWALNNTPWSWGYYERADIPVHFAIAEGWTVGDMYQESVVASTNPNRVTWASGSVNAPGGPQPASAGTYIDNNESPGCEKPGLNCFPLTWKTAAEYYTDAGVSWQVYQDTDNFDDNPLAWFKAFQTASNTSTLGKSGMSFVGLDKFYSDAAAGTLPQVSYIIGPAELSEHPPFQPKDGAWLHKQVLEAVVHGAAYKKTALIVSYDETGGWGDHVVPFHSPKDTKGEWMQDPYGNSGDVYTGPGFRVPFYIVSPYTRGGNVYVEHADHTSQIKFVEKWLQAKGTPANTTQIPPWRRQHMSDLTQAFDFNHPDFSIPSVPDIAPPSKNSDGSYDGTANCAATYSTQRPPVPFGKQTASGSLVSEQGFKPVRGQLTEGRYLTLEVGCHALTNAKGKLAAAAATPKHNGKAQRWVIHKVGGPQSTNKLFTLSSAVDGGYLGDGDVTTAKADKAVAFKMVDLGNGRGHTLQNHATGLYYTISGGKVVKCKSAEGFKVFSVTYSK